MSSEIVITPLAFFGVPLVYLSVPTALSAWRFGVPDTDGASRGAMVR